MPPRRVTDDESIENDLSRLRAQAGKAAAPTRQRIGELTRSGKAAAPIRQRIGELARSGSVPTGSTVREAAVVSVRSGLVASLESDCLQQRAEIKLLKTTVTTLQEGAGSRERADQAETALQDAALRLEKTRLQLCDEARRRGEAEDRVLRSEAEIEAFKQVTTQLHAARRQLRDVEAATRPALAEAEAARVRAEAEAGALGGRVVELEAQLAAQRDQAARAAAEAAETAAADATRREKSAATSNDERVASAEAEAQEWRQRCEVAEAAAVETSKLSAAKSRLEVYVIGYRTSNDHLPFTPLTHTSHSRPS